MLFDLLKWVTEFWGSRERKKSTLLASLSEELDRFTELMEEVLKITNEVGEIVDPVRAADVARMCERNRSRIITLIESGAYYRLDQDLQNEFEKKLKVVHYAPGSVVESFAMLEMGIREGRISVKARREFASAIDGVRDLATKMRLRAAVS